MSIDASTSTNFRELGEKLINAAHLLDAGSPLRDVDPTFDLVRAISAMLNEKPTYEARLAMALRDEHEKAASEHPLGVLILRTLTFGKSWTGTQDGLAELGSDLEIQAAFQPELLGVRHWFSRGISAAGALAYIGSDGNVHLARQQWFSLAGRITPKLTIEHGDAPRPVKAILRGAWASQGIDPEQCIYCQSAPFQEIEHFVPRSRGGTNDISNLFPACIKCNRGSGTGKWNKDPWEWLERVHPRRLPYFQDLFGIKPDDN